MQNHYDATGDVTGDVRWLSYAELGKARRISSASAKRLAFRHRWRRQKGNDGTVRVAVPVTEALPRSGNSDDDAGDDTRDDTDDITRIVSGFEAAIAAKDGEITRLLGQLERAEQTLAGERSRADGLRDRLDAARAEVVAKGAEAEQARERARTAEEQAEELRRENDARKARGRLRRAWDGWRGR